MSTQAAMSVGAAIAIREQFAGSRYWEVARETGATHCLLIGTMANFLLTREPSPAEREHSIRVATIAPMVDDPPGFRERYGIGELCSVYGQTEISLPLLVPPGGELVAGSLGRPRPGVEVRLVDEHDVPVPVGEVGELVVRTERPWEMNLGYHNRDDATVVAWRNGWFHTGDAFRRDDGDNYFFVDRTRDTLRRRGENVSSFQVETEVLAHPDVLEAACVAAPAELGEDEVKVFVVPVDSRAVDPRALVEFLVPRLPHFMVPRFVEIVNELPKTQTMRVQKFELRQRGNSPATWDGQAAGIRVTRRGIEESR
jgi:crotonobetaine/carnitine-CoA ligase